ncbi:MAG: Uma2 family endonuclease [Xenococcus sp. MO_188.B8]|nr:Uma2 family endonuclease [Xenococcus sp. MO_188.B8]
MVSLPSPLHLGLRITDEQFWQLCHQHHDLQFERTAEGELIIMSPTGGLTSDRNSDINFQLRLWNRNSKLGKVFDSSGGFKLPNGADRSPDAAWVELSRWNSLTRQQQERFVPLCPDFVIELRSPSDALNNIQNKMQEYLDNGAKLGWLIDPKRQVVEIYRPSKEVEILRSPNTIFGEDVLPGFSLDLTEIFNE